MNLSDISGRCISGGSMGVGQVSHLRTVKAINRGYTFLWRKTWANPVFQEQGKRFSRLEAWLYLVNVLASGIDNQAAGLRRGEFCTSVRRLANLWNWSPSSVFRFLRQLEQNRMITRLKHQAEQEAEHFIICNYSTYNPERNVERNTPRNTYKEGITEGVNKVIQDTHLPADAGACVSPGILLDIYRQQNQLLPGVKALTSERLKKCRSRINQAVRDGCLEQYLADFPSAVKKTQQTPFLRGEGRRAWGASFDWYVANQVNIYAVLEGKYEGPASELNGGNGGNRAIHRADFDCPPGGTSCRRRSRGDLMYHPRQ